MIEKEGFVTLKQYVEGLYQTAKITLQMATSPSVPFSTLVQQIFQAVKHLRDATVLVVRVSAHFIQSLEVLRSEREIVEVAYKILTQFTNLMLYVFLFDIIYFS